MTTPEKLRRRQLAEGGLLVAIGLFMVAQNFYWAAEDRDQRECLAENFQELSVALDKRADLTARETEQNQALWGIYAEAAGLVKDDPTQELKPADRAKLQRDLVAQLLEYQDVIGAIRSERRDNPLPPYPAGVCGA